MRNPFILLRFVLFFFLLYLNVLALGFASWNIAAAKKASVMISESGAPVFVLFNTIITIIYLLLALAELILPSFWSPKIVLECVWIAAFSVLGLAAAIDITVTGPIVACQAEGATSACASATLLVVVAWVSSSILLMYLFGLIGITTAHSSAEADVWNAAITSVPWFATIQTPLPSGNSKLLFYPKDPECQEFESPAFKDDASLHSASSKLQSTLKPAGILQSPLKTISISLPFSKSVESFRPHWAKDVKPRRGVDVPFLSPGKSQTGTLRLKSHWSSSTTSTYVPPVLPPKTRSPLGRQRSGEVEIEIPSQMSLPVITPCPSRPISYGIFPEDVQDPDMPIKPCRRSEWVRADNESR
ncbi:hypothetical protein DAEQUDRAFT_738932 [Daedalea quercina L-15889]|uniref:MARVEL domain-containing protein n=1 Tax=Daedalea quercina L-15889 TaxID=1314783 RepID=A0A165PHA0_9APHY|nr:hypothetical protein DAEQUDRAFT_738932 [Daedalea quercina L-15889]